MGVFRALMIQLSAGALGDCGALIHFDPTVIQDAAPFYCNAEYLVDLAKMKHAGDFISLETSNPSDAVVSEPVPVIDEMTTKLYSLSPWKNMKHGTLLFVWSNVILSDLSTGWWQDSIRAPLASMLSARRRQSILLMRYVMIDGPLKFQ
jgi:hypothetical protein